MILKFYSREGFMEPDPRFERIDGQPLRRIGRGLDGKALNEPTEIDSETPAGRRIVRVIARELDATRRAQVCPVYPADRETARACGVPFVPVELGADGEFVPVGKAKQ